jgi:SAM-dependent methyltransferase
LAALGLVGSILAEQLAAGPVPARVLDCGGGTGRLAVPLAQAGASVTVVDTSVDALATLARRAGEAGVAGRVRGVQGEFEALDAVDAPGPFDLVLAHDVLAMVDDPAALIAAVARRLGPGGVLSLRFANPVAAVLARAAAGDLAAAAAEVAALDTAGARPGAVLAALAAAGLTADDPIGLGALSGRPDRADEWAELDAAVARRRPFRDVAPALLVLARRPESPAS